MNQGRALEKAHLEMDARWMLQICPRLDEPECDMRFSKLDFQVGFCEVGEKGGRLR